MKSQGFRDGLFLIRHSETYSGCFVLSLAFNNNVQHYPIFTLRKKSGQIVLTLDGGKTKFGDLLQLVNHYELNVEKYLPTMLRKVVSSQEPSINPSCKS